MKKKYTKRIRDYIIVLLLVLVGLLFLCRDDMVILANQNHVLPKEVQVADSEKRSRSVGAGKNGTLNLRGDMITSKKIPVIDAWNIHGVATTGEQYYIKLNSPDGQNYSVYCLDYGKAANTGTVVAGQNMDMMESNMKEQLRACLSLGFSSQKSSLSNEEKSFYAATQAVIWNIMAGEFDTTIGDAAATQYLSYMEESLSGKEFYNSLKLKIKNHKKIPGFTSSNYAERPTYELVYNKLNKRYEAEMEDVEQLSSFSTFQSKDVRGDLQIAPSKTKVKLYTQNAFEGILEYEGTRNDVKLKECIIYWNNDAKTQRFGVSNIEVPAQGTPFYFRVKMGNTKINLTKVDAETKKTLPQGGAARFEGIKYNIFDEGYMEGDTKDSSSYVTTLILDSAGRANANDLDLKTYYVKEETPPDGYLLDEKLYRLSFPLTTYNDSPLEADIVSEEQVVRGHVELMKFGQDNDTEYTEVKKPLEGVEFTLTSLTNGNSFVLITDKTGYATTKLNPKTKAGIPYDTYTIEETKGKTGYKIIEPFVVKITDDGETLRYMIEDKLIQAAIRVEKRDSDTGKIIPLKGTKFKIVDENEKIVEMYTYYPKKEKVSIFETDETGTFLLPNRLPYGKYKLVEVQAPAGYLLSEPISFEVKKTSDYENPLTIVCEDKSAMGRICIKKTDKHTKTALEGIGFAIVAKEDIITPEGTIYVRAGGIIEEIVTDENGKAMTQKLHFGTYLVKELASKEGYAKMIQPAEVTLQYKDQVTDLVEYTLEIENTPTAFELIKIDEDTKKPLEGVEFTIWQESNGEEPIEKELYVTDKYGKIIMSYLTPGQYYVKETLPLSGYIASEETFSFVVDQNGRIEQKDIKSMVITNEKKKEGEKMEKLAPKTGDEGNLMLLIVIVIVSCTTAAVCAKIAFRKI